MIKSEMINEIAAALSKAQGEIQNATKNSINPHFKNKYADLGSVLEECRKSLTNHGLSFSQTTATNDNKLYLVTTIMHLSGQWIQSSMPIILSKQDMQGLGSAITYARRYSMAAICGISQEDDDGHRASEPKYDDEFDQTPKEIINHAPSKDVKEAVSKLQNQIVNNKADLRAACKHQYRAHYRDPSLLQCKLKLSTGEWCNHTIDKADEPLPF